MLVSLTTALLATFLVKVPAYIDTTVSYNCKNAYDIGSRGLYHKTYYGRNLQFP